MCFIASLYLSSSGKPLMFDSRGLCFMFILVQIPDKRLSDHLARDSNDGDDDDDDSDALSDVSSIIEEIRDDEDKIVRPCRGHRTSRV